MQNGSTFPLAKKEQDDGSMQDEQSPPEQSALMLREGSEFALHATQQSSGRRRKKFITRIVQLTPQPPVSLKRSYDHSLFPPPGIGVSSREKNNLAARLSRRRKKMYIELLEEQNTNLQMELYSLGEEIEMLRTEIFNAIMHADEVPSRNAEVHALAIKKLRALSQIPQRSVQTDAEINICLDSCIYRIGSSGSERKAILDILYQGFINRNLPNIYRFILWSSLHGFQRTCVDIWWQLMQVGHMKHNYNRFLDELGDGIAFKGREILRCASQILRKKKQIEQSGQFFDGLIKEFREKLTPAQFAQLFLFADRATPKRQLQLFQEEAVPDLCQGTRQEHTLSRKRRKMADAQKSREE